MIATCTHCQQPFEISDVDLAFYKKVSPEIPSTGLRAGAGKVYEVPPPTHCPDCRQQRRLSHRNERFLYHRKCDLSGKSMISNLAPEKDAVVYCQESWWSDDWDPLDYGKEIDFSRPFFEQFNELHRTVPQLGLHIWNCENCNYCNYAGDDKNCYLIFGSVYSEDCYYGSPYYSKDCMDTLVVRECERCYECVDCRKLYACVHCQDCHSSNDLIYCYDLQGCQDCIGCVGLRNKQFHIFNKEYSEAEYKKMKAELDLCIPAAHEKMQQEMHKIKMQTPHRYMQSHQGENVSGNYVYQCKGCHDCFYTDRSEDCRYCAQVVDMKDCYDNNYCEENELCYEYFAAYKNSRLLFSKLCQSSDCTYCDACHTSHNLFGCCGLRSKEYCILNKQYSKEEYEELVPKIINHMRETGEWGEFFPVSMSLFGYNETVANEYFPLSKEEAEAQGWSWFEEDPNQQSYMGPPAQVPQDIDDVSDDILEQILECEATGTLYRIIEQELRFLRENHLPIPRLCPNERHRRRQAMRNPRRLWDRECAKCEVEIQSSYAPDREEIVYCDSCYLDSLY